jgi:hypothetical protein
MRSLILSTLLLGLYLRHNLELLGEKIGSIRSRQNISGRSCRSQSLVPHSENLQYWFCTIVGLFVVFLLRFAFFNRAQTPVDRIYYICLEKE